MAGLVAKETLKSVLLLARGHLGRKYLPEVPLRRLGHGCQQDTKAVLNGIGGLAGIARGQVTQGLSYHSLVVSYLLRGGV